MISSSTANSTLTASLSGTGVSAIDTSVGTLNFGNLDVGATSTPLSFTVTNHTAVSIVLTSLTAQGDYSFASNCPSTLAGYAACSVTVMFKPVASGARPGMLVIATNNALFPTATVALAGTGVEFSLSLGSSSGSQIAGRSVQFNALLSPIAGFSNFVTVSCVSNAPGSGCAAEGSSVLVSDVNANDPVTITTTSQYAVIGYGSMGGGSRWLLGLLAFAASFGLLVRRRARAWPRLALLCVGLSVLLAGSGCSGKLPARNLTPTLPGTYSYTVIASDGFLIRTASYQLTVTAK